MMSPISGLHSIGWRRDDGRTSGSPEKIREVAAEFESLLVAHMLKMVRESSSGGWLGGGEDQAGSTMAGMAEAQFARAIASGGGLGLREVIEKGLLPDAPLRKEAELSDKQR